MRNLTCIVCPIGCSLDVEESSKPQDNLSVTGNRCPRGAAYAQEEIRAPKRIVTATCRIVDASAEEEASAGLGANSIKRIPVKTSSPCPKEKIPALLHDIYNTTIKLPVRAGDVVISSWQGKEIDVVVTRSICEYLSFVDRHC